LADIGDLGMRNKSPARAGTKASGLSGACSALSYSAPSQIRGRGSGARKPLMRVPRVAWWHTPLVRSNGRRWSWGQGEQERSPAALEAVGSKGQARPWSMGFGESEVSPVARVMARCLTRAKGQRDATGERQRLPCQDGVVLPRTSCIRSYKSNSLQQLACWGSSPAHGLDRAHLWLSGPSVSRIGL
jgi:hypothetical protein